MNHRKTAVGVVLLGLLSGPALAAVTVNNVYIEATVEGIGKNDSGGVIPGSTRSLSDSLTDPGTQSLANVTASESWSNLQTSPVSFSNSASVNVTLVGGPGNVSSIQLSSSSSAQATRNDLAFGSTTGRAAIGEVGAAETSTTALLFTVTRPVSYSFTGQLTGSAIGGAENHRLMVLLPGEFDPLLKPASSEPYLDVTATASFTALTGVLPVGTYALAYESTFGVTAGSGDVGPRLRSMSATLDFQPLNPIPEPISASVVAIIGAKLLGRRRRVD
jgi:hypothetical protein